MITAGKGVDEFLFGAKRVRGGIVHYLRSGDIVIDAGNSFFEDSVRRAKIFAKKGIRFMDIGFSGGPRGARHGGSLMIGGDHATFEYLEPLFTDVSVPNGYSHFGDAGAGHFVKMVHNGIEYGMMQSLAEGFALMKKSPFKLDLEKVASVYNRGSVIESRLVGWMEDAFSVYGEELREVSARSPDRRRRVDGRDRAKMENESSGDPRRIPIPRPLQERAELYGPKIFSALRNRFGGHSVEKP